MLKEELMKTMIAYSEGNRKDVAHFVKVWGYAHTIGILEGLDEHTQNILEMTAIVHDIAVPLCRVKYNLPSGSGKYQEIESEALLRPFLKQFDIAEEDKERMIWLVAHHHTYTDVDGIDHRILLEADYLVNSEEKNLPAEAVRNFRDNVFRTKTGTELLNQMFQLEV